MTNYVKEYKGFKVPEWAVYYSPANECFYNKDKTKYYYSRDNFGWDDVDNFDCARNATELPQEPESKEWDGEGLPPIGAFCEALDTLMAHPEYCLVMIKGFYNNQVWLTYEDGFDRALFTGDLKFRPLKTQEQKDREAFIEQVNCALFDDAGSVLNPQDAKAVAIKLFNTDFKAPEG